MESQLRINQSNNYVNRNLNKQNASFKGVGTVAIGALRFLDNSPAIGACAVDLGSMVIPRTIIDTKDRGANAGAETAFRESSSTINHAIAGLVGAGAATLVSGAINNKYGIKADKTFVNSDAIDVFNDYWKLSNGNKKTYFENVLSNITGLNGSVWNKISDVKDADGSVVKKGSEIISEVADKLASSRKLTKELKQEILNTIVSNTGASSRFKLSAATDAASKPVLNDSLDVVIENMHSLSNTFSDAVKKGVKDFDFDTFAKELKSVKTKSSLLGLGTTALIGASIQPINRYLTKKRTGTDGFVGVEGREADKSQGFKFMKLAAASAFGLIALASIDKNPRKILNKLQFRSKIPNLDQFKLVYGATIFSRFLAARDKSELRESCVRDTLGFTNWLLLGGIVSKLVARGLDKNLINYADSGKTGIKKAFDWIAKSSIKSYDEVVVGNAKNVLTNAGKALNFKQILSSAKDTLTKTKVGKLALAQIAGYAYSGLVLGVGIAKLNIFITDKIEKGKKKNQQPISTQNSSVNANDANVKFLTQNSQQNKVFAKIQK